MSSDAGGFVSFRKGDGLTINSGMENGLVWGFFSSLSGVWLFLIWVIKNAALLLKWKGLYKNWFQILLTHLSGKIGARRTETASRLHQQ